QLRQMIGRPERMLRARREREAQALIETPRAFEILDAEHKMVDGLLHHYATENRSMTQSHVPSACRRATSEDTLPSDERVEVRARSPLRRAGRCGPNSYFRPVAITPAKNARMASLPRSTGASPLSSTASGS